VGNREFAASIMRGGTSKGIVFPLEMLPDAGPGRDAFLIGLMGSTDAGQIDGFGGATSTTSKVMMVGSTDREDADVEYFFAQVHPRRPVVDYGGNCGNMTAAVALYSVLEGLVTPVAPATEFVMLNRNTGTRVRARVPTDEHGAAIDGTYTIAGISRPGPEVVTEYLEPAGASGMLPTGAARETVTLPGGDEITVSIVDISSPLVFVKAEDLGLSGVELPEDIDSRPELLEVLEFIRGTAAVRMGLVERVEDAAEASPGIPKMTFVRSPVDYVTSTGETVHAADVDIVARTMSVGRAHHSFALTGTMCTVAAAVIPGTVVSEVAQPDPSGPVRLGHPKGVNTVGVSVAERDGTVTIQSVTVSRTARRMMRGVVDPFLSGVASAQQG
jgi:2-methylaconitate cis-trans-isomerase PrpF